MGNKLVEEEDGSYRLTNAGTILVRRLVPLIRTFRDPAHPPESPLDLSRRYHEYESGMNALLLSGHALAILCALREGPLSRDALRDLTGARSTTLRTRIRLLTGSGHLREDGNGFSLTLQGGKVAEEVHRFLRTIALLSRLKEFWNQHDISVLPDFAIDTIYCLDNVEISIDTPGNVTSNLRHYYKCVTEAEWISGISEWAYPEMRRAYSKAVMSGRTIHLLFPPDVIAAMNRDPSAILSPYPRYPNLKIWVTSHPLGFALTVMDSVFIIRLYAKDGVSFTNTRLAAFHSEEMNRWGLSVFDYFRDQSTEYEQYLKETAEISSLPSPES